MATLGAIRGVLGDGAPQIALFLIVSLAVTSAVWSFTAWLMLMGQVRWRVLVPSGVLIAIATGVYAVSANIWMPEVVTRNYTQFGFFGIALALVTWFSGTAICILIGACAGAVFAADTGRVGRLIRGPEPSLLVDGAALSLPASERGLRLRDAFRPTEDDVSDQ
jgi:membrane protein